VWYDTGVFVSITVHASVPLPLSFLSYSLIGPLPASCVVSCPLTKEVHHEDSLVLLTVFIVVLLSISLVLANPALLPKHPGIPEARPSIPSAAIARERSGSDQCDGGELVAQAAAFDDVHVRTESVEQSK